MFQGLAMKKFHCDKLLTLVLTDVVNGADVWMIQRRRSLCLAPEPLKRLTIMGHANRKELERDMPMQAQILGFVNLTHTSLSDKLNDPESTCEDLPRLE